MKTKIKMFISVVFFGVACLVTSLVYSKNEWNLTQLSKADPSAKAWLIEVKGDSVLVRRTEASTSEMRKSEIKREIRKDIRLVEKRKIEERKNSQQFQFSDPYAIYEGDMIVTGVGDRATILLRDGSVIWVDSLTVFKISELNVPSVVPGQSAENYKVNLKLRVGAVRIRVPKVRTVQKKFSVQTPQGTASVRGTEQVVQYSPGFGLQVNVLSGLVEVENQAEGVQYASRGEKVAVSTESGAGVETVNQQRRAEVQKSIQIASGRASSETQELTPEVQEATQVVEEEVKIVVLPKEVLPKEIPGIIQPKPKPQPKTPVPISQVQQNFINSQTSQMRGFLNGGHIGFVPARINQLLNGVESHILSLPPSQRVQGLKDIFDRIWDDARKENRKHMN